MKFLPFVPYTYSRKHFDGYILWHDQDELSEHIGIVVDATSFSLSWLRKELKFQNKRELNICLYRNNMQARLSLGRNVTGSMAMMPFSSETKSLVIVQNASADPINGDIQRMKRIMVHEICHAFIREKTYSSAQLGDRLKNLKVQPWLDEGFAEVLSEISNNTKHNTTIENQYERNWDVNDIDRYLNDLSSENRSIAFKMASGKVRALIEKAGIPFVFDNLARISISSVIGQQDTEADAVFITPLS